MSNIFTANIEVYFDSTKLNYIFAEIIVNQTLRL